MEVRRLNTILNSWKYKYYSRLADFLGVFFLGVLFGVFLGVVVISVLFLGVLAGVFIGDFFFGTLGLSRPLTFLIFLLRAVEKAC